MITRLKSIALKSLRWLYKSWPRSRGVTRILLDTRSSLTATYLEDLREAFGDDSRLLFFKTVRPNIPVADRQRCLALVNCPEISYRSAKFYPWDLIVLADHPTDHIEDLTARSGVLRIPHGLGSKLVNGQDYFYGPGLYARNGRLRYSCIFESSETRRDKFTAANPDLKDVIRLVGDLRIDKLLQFAERARSREKLNARPTVVLAGSWSSGNLFEKLGPQLFAEAASLLDQYAFIIRPHPHVFNVGTVAHSNNSPEKWKLYFEEQQKLGFVLSPPTDDPGWLLSAATVVICDDLSSMALYAAVLGKRIIMVRSGSDQVAPESFCARLAHIAPNLTSAADLREALVTALQQEPLASVKSLSSEINSRPGQSTQLVRSELYRLLNLAPLTQSASAAESRAPGGPIIRNPFKAPALIENDIKPEIPRRSKVFVSKNP